MPGFRSSVRAFPHAWARSRCFWTVAPGDAGAVVKHKMERGRTRLKLRPGLHDEYALQTAETCVVMRRPHELEKLRIRQSDH
jgi:hypothetical protein